MTDTTDSAAESKEDKGIMKQSIDPKAKAPAIVIAFCFLCIADKAVSQSEEQCIEISNPNPTHCDTTETTDTDLSPGAEPGTTSKLAVLDIEFRSDTGYIDSAFVRNQFRVRYDWNRDSEFPDRAEFIYGQCDCNPPQGVSPGPAADLDYGEVEVNFEYPFTQRFSIFGEVPYRSIDLEIPEVVAPSNPKRGDDGIGDIRAGIKYAIIAQQHEYLTFQLRGYFPTGDESENLGTGHNATEPALLYYRSLSDHWSMESELRWWHPWGDDTDYSGDILRFGVGASYRGPDAFVSFSPVTELVTWYVLDGKKTDASTISDTNPFPQGPKDASDDTIVNLKLGVRVRIGGHPGSVYLGYGFALTDEDWYDEVFRVEYRHNLPF